MTPTRLQVESVRKRWHLRSLSALEAAKSTLLELNAALDGPTVRAGDAGSALTDARAALEEHRKNFGAIEIRLEAQSYLALTLTLTLIGRSKLPGPNPHTSSTLTPYSSTRISLVQISPPLIEICWKDHYAMIMPPESEALKRGGWRKVKANGPAGYTEATKALARAQQSAKALKEAVLSAETEEPRHVIQPLSCHAERLEEKAEALHETDDYNEKKSAFEAQQKAVAMLSEGPEKAEAEDRLTELQAHSDSSRKRWHFGVSAAHEGTKTTLLDLKSSLETLFESMSDSAVKEAIRS